MWECVHACTVVCGHVFTISVQMVSRFLALWCVVVVNGFCAYVLRYLMLIHERCSASVVVKTECGHTLCRSCLGKVVGTELPYTKGSCPYCRASISLYSCKDEQGRPLETPETRTARGCVFVQGEKPGDGVIGFASYHFLDGENGPYIS